MSAAAVPRVLVLTDRRGLPRGRTLGDQVGLLAGSGLTQVLLREPDLEDDERRRLAECARAAGLVVWASRRPVPGAAGVHLPASAPTPSGALPWGRSCHDPGEVARAAADGASWVTLSPFAPTASKPGYGPPVPRAWFASLPVPALALGGIDPSNAGDAIAAGAHGVALMGAVMRAEDPAGVVHAVVAAVRGALAATGREGA